jgi:hypothetical protein
MGQIGKRQWRGQDLSKCGVSLSFLGDGPTYILEGRDPKWEGIPNGSQIQTNCLTGFPNWNVMKVWVRGFAETIEMVQWIIVPDSEPPWDQWDLQFRPI